MGMIFQWNVRMQGLDTFDNFSQPRRTGNTGHVLQTDFIGAPFD
jgi:hypothetical protein